MSGIDVILCRFGIRSRLSSFGTQPNDNTARYLREYLQLLLRVDRSRKNTNATASDRSKRKLDYLEQTKCLVVYSSVSVSLSRLSRLRNDDLEARLCYGSTAPFYQECCHRRSFPSSNKCDSPMLLFLA